MGADFHFFDGGAEIEKRFMDGASWLDDPVHQPWSEMPDLHIGQGASSELEYADS